MFKYFRSPEDFARLLRRHFLAGVFVLIPFAVVAWILNKILSALWTLHLLIPEDWKPIHYFDPFIAELLNIALTIGITIIAMVLVSMLGWSSKRIIGARVLRFLSYLVQKIPVVRAIYSSLNQLLKTMAAGDKQQFSRVVYIEYPRAGSWALAFVTGDAHVPAEFGKKRHLNVYVPTTPNPTSGFHLIVAEADVRDSGLSVENAFKTILSLGIAQSESKDIGGEA
jgi:uncharacterized membrane protein